MIVSLLKRHVRRRLRKNEGMSWTEDDEGGEGNCIDEGIQDDDDDETMID